MTDDFTTPPALPTPPDPVDAQTWSIWLSYQRLLDDRARHAEQIAAQAEHARQQRAACEAVAAQTKALHALADAIRAYTAR